LSSAEAVAALAHNREEFLALIGSQISKTPANFEIFSFAVVKVHLEKFACKIYRDSRTSAHDHGVDFSTNFGVVYQIKKLRIRTESDTDKVCAELKLNFDKERLSDGNVILVIDDISKVLKQYLVRMCVKSLTKADLVNIASNFEEFENRQRVCKSFMRNFAASIPAASRDCICVLPLSDPKNTYWQPVQSASRPFTHVFIGDAFCTPPIACLQ